jgi:hypothetical protein
MLQPNHLGGGLFGRRSIGSQAGKQHRLRSRLPGAVAEIQHDGLLSTRCAQLCVVGVVKRGPGGHAGLGAHAVRRAHQVLTFGGCGSGEPVSLPRPRMTPTAIRATHSEAAAVPSPITHGHRLRRASVGAVELSTATGSLCVACCWARRRTVLAHAEKGADGAVDTGGRYPRLDFFASAECHVVHGSATCDSADQDAETIAQPRPTHLSTSGALSSC